MLNIALTILCLITTNISFACRGNELRPKETFEKAIESSAFAFVGIVTSIDSSSGKDRLATFKVDKTFKKMNTDKLSFKIQTGRSCDLGKYLEMGSRWFILASKEGETIFTASHSRRLFNLKEEQEILDLIKK